MNRRWSTRSESSNHSALNREVQKKHRTRLIGRPPSLIWPSIDWCPVSNHHTNTWMILIWWFVMILLLSHFYRSRKHYENTPKKRISLLVLRPRSVELHCRTRETNNRTIVFGIRPRFNPDQSGPKVVCCSIANADVFREFQKLTRHRIKSNTQMPRFAYQYTEKHTYV